MIKIYIIATTTTKQIHHTKKFNQNKPHKNKIKIAQKTSTNKSNIIKCKKKKEKAKEKRTLRV